MLLPRVCTALLILHVARGQHVLNCSHVRTLLRNRGVTELTDGTSNGSGVCRVGVGCCGAEWDRGFLTESRSYLHSQINAFTASAVSQLSQHYTQVQGTVLLLLRSAKSNVFGIFRDNYPRSSRRFGRLTSIFFNRLERFLQNDGSTSDLPLIRGSVEQFLDRLTVSVYGSVSSRRAIRGGRLQRCATSYRRSDLKQHLHRLRSGLGGLLEPVRLYLHSLKLARQVLESCGHLAFSDSCDRGVARLQLCPLCWGLDRVTACPGFCHNVVGGCLAPLKVLDGPWKALLVALRRQQAQVRRAVFLDSGSFVRVDRIVLEVVFVMWNNADDVRSQVDAHCVNMSVAEPSAAPGWSSATEEPVDEPDEDLQSSWPELADAHPPHPTFLNNQLNIFNRAAADMMSLFAGVSKGICSSTEQRDSLCWNGENLGRYSKRILDESPDSQWINAEIRVPPLKGLPGVEEMLQTLRLAREVLEIDVRLAPSVGGLQSSGDGEWVEGSGEGSGDWIYGQSDDEDASGSGAGPDHNSGFSDDEDGTVWRIHSGIGDTYVPVKSTDTHVSNPSTGQDDNLEDQETSADGVEQVTDGAALLTPSILWIALQVVFL